MQIDEAKFIYFRSQMNTRASSTLVSFFKFKDSRELPSNGYTNITVLIAKSDASCESEIFPFFCKVLGMKRKMGNVNIFARNSRLDMMKAAIVFGSKNSKEDEKEKRNLHHTLKLAFA